MEECCRMCLGYTRPHPHHLYHLSQPIDYRIPILNLNLSKKNQKMLPKLISPGSIDSKSNLACTSPTSTTLDETNSQKKITTTKPPRPFKVFPKDSLQLVIGMSTHGNILRSPSSVEEYVDFRKKILSQVETSTDINKSMRRSQVPAEKAADPEYLERRKKNNEAARRSREARKAKEDEIAIRCAFLEQENIKLKFHISALESELGKLQRSTYY